MPRKPKLAVPLVIQSLSTGRIVQERAVDDFSGQRIDQHCLQDTAHAPLIPRSSESYMRERSEQRLHASQAVLRSAGRGDLLGDKLKLVEAVPKGKRKVTEFNGLAVLVDIPKWRRV